MKPSLKIGKHKVGAGQPVYIVAEMSANHNQNYEEAVGILQAAKACGADAVKLQTYTADTMTLDSNNQHFRIGKGTVWEGQTLHQLYGQAYTPWEWQPRLQKEAQKLGLDLFSSAFDFSAVDFLEDMGIPAHKVASFELVDIPLIQKMAETGKPIIMSTGMASLNEIEEAVKAARQAGARQIALLKCTSAYPAKLEDMNLNAIPDLAKRFKVVAGISDHTMGLTVPVAAVALGARIIEKHLTLSRAVAGPDASFSLEPKEFKEMVQAVRETEKALGQIHYGPGKDEKNCLIFRRSLFAAENIQKGEKFTEKNIRSIRPASGLHTRYWEMLLGKRAPKNIAKGSPLTKDLLK